MVKFDTVRVIVSDTKSLRGMKWQLENLDEHRLFNTTASSPVTLNDKRKKELHRFVCSMLAENEVKLEEWGVEV